MKGTKVKKYKSLIQNFLGVVIVLSVYLLSIWLLNVNGLAYRNYIHIAVYVVIFLFVLAIIVQLLIILYKKAKDRMSKLWLRIAAGIGIPLMILATLYISFWGVLLGVMGYKPEHVVNVNGEKMVASVNSFLKVFVDYYPYKNVIVRGNRVILAEYYGTGGYDPFTGDELPEPIYFTRYDDEGKVIDTNAPWIDLPDLNNH